MKTRLVSMGNSRGVRLPKPLIEQVGLKEEVVLQVRDGGILIAPFSGAREGWAKAAVRCAANEPGGLVDPSVSTRFDDSEWRW